MSFILINTFFALVVFQGEMARFGPKLILNSMEYTRNLLLIVSFSVLTLNISAQQINLKTEQARNFQEKKLIVVTTGDAIVDTYLKEAIELKWSFNDDIQYMSLEESKDLVEEQPDEFVRLKLQLLKGVMVYTSGEGVHRTEFSRHTYGDVMKLVLFEDAPKGFEVALPSNSEFSRGIAIELVQRACHVVSEIEKVGSWNKFYFSTKSSGLSKLSERTLLVPIEYIANEEDTVEMIKNYPYSIEFIPSNDIHMKVEESNADYAYLLVAEELVNVHVHYICLAENSEVLGHHHKVVQTLNTIQAGVKHLYIDKKVFKKLLSKL